MRRRMRDCWLGLAVVALVALLAGWAGPGQALARVSLAQDDEVDGATAIGVPEPGETAWELIAQSDRGNQDVALAGFLTFVAGADPELLFTRTDRRTEETARFAVVAELDIEGASAVDTVRAETTVGTLTVHFLPDGGGDFADPASFAAGTAVAGFDVRTQDVLYGRSASSTLVASSGEAAQTSAEPFDHGGTTYRLGGSDTRLALSLTGVDSRESTEPNRTRYVLAGRAELTGGVNPIDEDPSTDPDATADVAADPCASIAPWFETTSAQADDIEVLVDFILAVESGAELDASQLRAAAEALALLAEQQRTVELPAEAADVSAALADAIAAIGAATAAAAAAIEAGSADDFAAAQADLSIARDDLRAALAEAETLAAPCA